MIRGRTFLALSAAAVLVLAGCADGSDSTSGNDPGAMMNDGMMSDDDETPSTSYVEADVSFLQAIIPHHQQAIAMAAMAQRAATTESLKRLAGRIEAAQRPEIDQMTTWLHGGTPSEVPERYAESSPITHAAAVAAPLLIIHGTADKVTRCGGSQLFQAMAGSDDKTLKLYEGYWHDPLADLGRETVADDIVAWIGARTPA